LAHPVETRDIDTLVRELWKAARAAAETGRASLKKSLEELNSDTMAGHGIAGGLSMAEAISKQFADNSYTNHDSPRIIFYSSSNGGGVVASQCARIATNRVDVLFQNLVSALEEIRWEKLKQLGQI
jgi:hypothetical protein